MSGSADTIMAMVNEIELVCNTIFYVYSFTLKKDNSNQYLLSLS